MVGAVVRAAGESHTGLHLVLAVPVPEARLVELLQLVLVGRPVPGIEEVASPSIGRYLHVGRSLPVRIAVEPGVTKDRVHQRSGGKLVAVICADRYAPEAIVRRCALRHQRTDIRVSRAIRKSVYRPGKQVLRREHGLEAGEGIKT